MKKKEDNKNQKIKNFNPSDVALYDGIFGLPFNAEESNTILIPVPWEVTVSYHSGTAKGPQAILNASYQVDLYDPFLENAWQKGIYIDKVNSKIQQKSKLYRKKAEQYFKLLDKNNVQAQKQKERLIKEIDSACHWLNDEVRMITSKYLMQKKLVGLIGGDHSTPFGFIEAVGEQHGNFSILHIDAHADLRQAYQNLKYSHASIMHNIVHYVKPLTKLVQVGIRDYCEDEKILADTHKKIKSFYDKDIKHNMYRGESWDKICNRIVNELSEKVYLSFDIDGLDPKLCPNTGTAVAGGFETEQVLYLLEKLVLSGKKIIAFDINEVAPGKNNDWDANVAARLLYRIINIAQKNFNR